MYYGSLLSHKLNRILSHSVELCCCFFFLLSLPHSVCAVISVLSTAATGVSWKTTRLSVLTLSATLIAFDLMHGSLFFSSLPACSVTLIRFLLSFKRQQTSTLYNVQHRNVLAYVLAELCSTAVSDCRYCNRPLTNKLYFRYSFFFRFHSSSSYYFFHSLRTDCVFARVLFTRLCEQEPLLTLTYCVCTWVGFFFFKWWIN